MVLGEKAEYRLLTSRNSLTWIANQASWSIDFRTRKSADLRRSNLVIESACGAVAVPKATALPALFRVLKCLSFRLGYRRFIGGGGALDSRLAGWNATGNVQDPMAWLVSALNPDFPILVVLLLPDGNRLLDGVDGKAAGFEGWGAVS
jgi:hypothetical protein